MKKKFLNKKIKKMTPFWSFLTFSLLSYIEIYIEYREKASGVMWEPLGGSKKNKKFFFCYLAHIEARIDPC